MVNDGSTDDTASIIESIEDVSTLSFPKNRGKGEALKTGFAWAKEKQYSHVITFDADGQHHAEDLDAFLGNISKEPETLWVGNRVIPFEGSEDQPLRSRFGRAFGNFWYKFFTSIKLNDTQCGFRAYPLRLTASIKCSGTRYEYEQDLLIRSAWAGIQIKEIPIHLNYLSKKSRVSHFRPIRDFLAISRVNSKAAMTRIFLPVTALEVPGNTWRAKIKSLVMHELRAHTTPKRAAASLALGVFFGIFPIHGLQVITLIGASILLKLNRALAFLGVNVSSPPFMPLLIIVAVAIGKLVLPPDIGAIAENIENPTIQRLLQGGLEFVVGSVILSVPASLMTYAISLPIIRRLAKSRLFKK